MSITDHQLIVITPVYEDIEASSRLFRELAHHFQENFFLVAVDDGSIKQPLEIDSLETASIDGVILKLRCNGGHQRAISIGLGYVAEHLNHEQYVVIMDSDGEDLPSTIPVLLDRLRSDAVDIAVAQRKSRIETFRFKVFHAIYKRLFSLLTGKSINFGNFMALKHDAAKRLVAMPELSVHVAGTVLASKQRVETCLIDRGPRYAGQSKMNFVGLTLHGFRALMVFAEDVLVRVGLACAIIATLSVLGALIALLLKLTGHATPGWFTVAFGVLLLTFLQTGALTLMTLLLTGVVRGGVTLKMNSYKDFIETIVVSRQDRY